MCLPPPYSHFLIYLNHLKYFQDVILDIITFCLLFFLVHRAGTKYTVSVFGMFEGGESVPLAGEENTTYSDEPDPPPYEGPSKVA